MKNILLLLLGVFLIMASCTRNETDDFKAFFFRNDGADLYVEINGNIDSDVFILFLHGGPGGGNFGYNQGYAFDKLEEDYAMVYLDQRGNGASQGNYDRETLTIEQNSKDIYQLTQFLKAEYSEDITLFLAGHSWGGLTSAHALIYTDLQEDVNGWIEINGAHDFAKNDIEAVKMFQEFATAEIANGNNLNFWETVLERVNEMDTLNITDEESGYLNSIGFDAENQFDLGSTESTSDRNLYSPNNPEFGLYASVANSVVNPILNNDSENYLLTDQLYQIEIPSLFIWGKYDFVVPPALGVSAHNLVNTTEKKIVIFENSGHGTMDNEGELFVQEVKEFVELYR